MTSPAAAKHMRSSLLCEKARVPSEKYHQEGGRTSYLGSEVFLSVTDQSKPLVDEHIHQLSVDAWCTNRDLPLLMARSKTSDF